MISEPWTVQGLSTVQEPVPMIGPTCPVHLSTSGGGP